MINNKRLALSTVAAAVFTASAQSAVYEVVELASNEQGLQNFAAAIGEQGSVVTQVQYPVNPPIDVDLLDLENNEALREQLDDPEAVEAGDISNDDRVTLYNVLSNADSLQVQQIGEIQSYIGDAMGTTQVVGFDQASTAYEGLTQSVNTFVYDINSTGTLVGTGTAPFSKLSYVNEDDEALTYMVRDFNQRGFVSIEGQTIPLIPPEDTLGGLSMVRGLSDNLWAAGYVSTDISDSLVDLIDSCNDPEERGDRPKEACLTALMGSGNPGFQLRAALWKLNQDGTIDSLQTFPLAFEPEEDSTRLNTAQTYDVNDAGVGVGRTEIIVERFNDALLNFPAIFHDGQVKPLLDEEEYRSGTAVKINNNSLITGFGNKLVNGFERSKFFVYDMDTEKLSFPEDFFPGSSSLPRGINDQGVIVGEGEVDTVTGSNTTRRRHGFIYDHSEQRFQDLNDLLTCDSPYTIVQANDINENGEIAATAVVEQPKRNIAGETITDDEGNTEVESTVISVKLNPIPGGEAEDCADSEDKVERQAGSATLWLLLGLTGLVGWRRRR